MKSRIWNICADDLQRLIDESDSISEVLKKLGYKSKGGSFSQLTKRIERDGLDLTGLEKRRSEKKRNLNFEKTTPLEDILVKGSSYNRSHLKARLISSGILTNRCAICKMEPVWKGKKLVLVLDHINGINNDNREKNLRLLCPNCNSQMDTFSKGNPNARCPIKKICRVCKKVFRVPRSKASKMTCSDQCRIELNRRDKLWCRKAKNRPSKEELEQMIATMSWLAIGRKYGVSDNAVRKWAKRYGIIK